MWQQPGGWRQPPGAWGQQWPIQQSAYANMAHDQGTTFFSLSILLEKLVFISQLSIAVHSVY